MKCINCSKGFTRDKGDDTTNVCPKCAERLYRKVWEPCQVCGEMPIVSGTGMCGPCTWGEAETAGGTW